MKLMLVSRAPPEKLQGYKQGPGLSAYIHADGTVHRTYLTTARGLEPAMGYYGLLDRTPVGRKEGEQDFWLRRHDEYDDAPSSANT